MYYNVACKIETVKLTPKEKYNANITLTNGIKIAPFCFEMRTRNRNTYYIITITVNLFESNIL